MLNTASRALHRQRPEILRFGGDRHNEADPQRQRSAALPDCKSHGRRRETARGKALPDIGYPDPRTPVPDPVLVPGPHLPGAGKKVETAFPLQ